MPLGQVYIRPYNKEKDHGLLAEWLFTLRAKNRFDPGIFERGQAAVYTAFDDSGVLGFIPVVNGNQVESLAFRPGLPATTIARVFQAWVHVFVYEAHCKNIPDAFFVTFDEGVLKFAESYGWKPVVVPMLNLRISALEGPTPEKETN